MLIAEQVMSNGGIAYFEGEYYHGALLLLQKAGGEGGLIGLKTKITLLMFIHFCY